MKELSIELVKSEFSFIRSWTGNQENYHGTYFFPHQAHFCDVWFVSPKKAVVQAQIDRFNTFVTSYEQYFDSIDEFLLRNLSPLEWKSFNKINEADFEFEVIQVPFNRDKYDFVLVCSKNYKWLLWKRSITIRVEFRNGRINSMKRTEDSTEDNDS